MTEIYTSRNTKITKISERVKASFTLGDVRSVQGIFPNELNEMHRYKGSELDIAQLRDNTTPNTEAIETEAASKAKQEIQAILPILGDGNDPVITDVRVNIEFDVEYTKAPYIETKVLEYSDDGRQIEVSVPEVNEPKVVSF